MAERVQTRNGRVASGRVTPSKLRRGAVIAVDGAWPLGAGALGGLFATGPGPAQPPPHAWLDRRQTPAPAGSDGPASRTRRSHWDSDSCVSAAFCVAGGSYEDSSPSTRPCSACKAAGTWSVAEAPLPSNADPRRDSAHRCGISCPEVGSCDRHRLVQGHRTGQPPASSRPSPGAPGRPWTRPCPRMPKPVRTTCRTSSRSTARRPRPAYAVGYYRRAPPAAAGSSA